METRGGKYKLLNESDQLLVQKWFQMKMNKGDKYKILDKMGKNQIIGSREKLLRFK